MTINTEAEQQDSPVLIVLHVFWKALLMDSHKPQTHRNILNVHTCTHARTHKHIVEKYMKQANRQSFSLNFMESLTSICHY